MKSISEKILLDRFLTLTLRNILCLTVIATLSSCSWVSSKRSLFGDDEVQTQSVPKEQYEQLQKRYNELLAKAKASPEKTTTPDMSPEDIVNQLNQAKESNDLVETVDVFSSEYSQKRPVERQAQAAPVEVAPSEVESQIIKLERAQSLTAQNKFDQSLTILKELERSDVKQIKVRAKYEIGELLFIQGEYDLAMQVFEEIIHKQAFSGIVLKVLGRLIVCSEKLKLAKKKQQYYSVLHDFFEQA